MSKVDEILNAKESEFVPTLSMVREFFDSLIKYFSSQRTHLVKLCRMHQNTDTIFFRQITCDFKIWFGEINRVRFNLGVCESWENITTQSKTLNTMLMVPLDHWNQIFDVLQSQFFCFFYSVSPANASSTVENSILSEGVVYTT